MRRKSIVFICVEKKINSENLSEKKINRENLSEKKINSENLSREENQ